MYHVQTVRSFAEKKSILCIQTIQRQKLFEVSADLRNGFFVKRFGPLFNPKMVLEQKVFICQHGYIGQKGHLSPNINDFSMRKVPFSEKGVPKTVKTSNNFSPSMQ